MAMPGEPSLSKERRRAFTLLARTHGTTEETLVLAYGFDRIIVATLVDTGLTTAHREIVAGPGRTRTEVVHIRISDAGRRAIEG
jgi:hypothetical protein